MQVCPAHQHISLIKVVRVMMGSDDNGSSEESSCYDSIVMTSMQVNCFDYIPCECCWLVCMPGQKKKKKNLCLDLNWQML